MDLRVKRTRQNIRDAFIQLRMKKPLEKITVKELCERAEINKATFYLHYSNIYELSETIENGLIESCFACISSQDIMDPEKAVPAIYATFSEQKELFYALFSDGRIAYLAQKISDFTKERFCQLYPELAERQEFHIRLTAAVYGCFYAYLEYKDQGADMVIAHLGCLVKQMLYAETECP